MLWSFEGMLSKATTRVCRGGLDFCSLNIFRHFLWRLLGQGLLWAQCFKKKSLSEQVHLLSFAGPFQKLLENGIMDAEWGGRLFEEMPKEVSILPDRVCLPGKSGKF